MSDRMENMTIFDILPEAEHEKFALARSDDWDWTFSDYPKEKNGLKVFSCFACGGGSTMGYKLTGCDVLGCVEIDQKMNDIYVRNHHPKYNFCMDIRDFNALPAEEIPEELFHLDILDGSPPCTTFSIAGQREESWGKKKKFREGQKEQTLDDLSFVFIETVAKLKPRVVIMENVEGILLGEAWSYVAEIHKRFKEIGYKSNHWLLKGERMGVPQTRHRTIFAAVRQDNPVDLYELNMHFAYEPVLFGSVKRGEGKSPGDTEVGKWLRLTKPEDKRLADAVIRAGLPEKLFGSKVFQDHNVAQTITATGEFLRGTEKTYVSREDIIGIQTFPRDYDFGDDTLRTAQYVCGMSVPLVMMKRVVTRLIEQGVFDSKDEREEHA